MSGQGLVDLGVPVGSIAYHASFQRHPIGLFADTWAAIEKMIEAGPEGRGEAAAGWRGAASDRSGRRGTYRPRSLPWPARPRRALPYWVHPSADGVTRRCGRP